MSRVNVNMMTSKRKIMLGKKLCNVFTNVFTTSLFSFSNNGKIVTKFCFNQTTTMTFIWQIVLSCQTISLNLF